MSIRGIITNLMVVVITLVLCLFLLEICLRVYHAHNGISMEPPVSPYREISHSGGSRLIPGADVMYRFESTVLPVRVRINSLGCRGPEIPMPEQDDHRRLLILGDSVAFGYGVDEDDLFSAQLDSALDALKPPWRAVNASVEDIGIKDQRMILQELGSRVRPAHVLVMFYANDSRPPVGFGDEFLLENRLDRWFRTHPNLTASSHAARFIQFRYRSLLTRFQLYDSPVAIRFRWVDPWRAGQWRIDRQALQTLIESARFDWGAAWFDESWEVVEAELDRIQELCSALGSGLAVCYLPVQIQAEAEIGVDLSAPQRKLTALCRERGIPFLDLLPELRGKKDMFIDQCHLTEPAHALIGSKLILWLNPMLERAIR